VLPERVVSASTELTLEDALFDRIAKRYHELIGKFRDVLNRQLEARNSAQLRSEALTSWQRVLDHLAGKREHSLLRDHIKGEILPFVERTSLADTIFVMFFFADRGAGLKRAWCPRSPEILKGLGFPYTVDAVAKGLDFVPGLPRWEVPLSSDKGKGLRGDLRHQHCSDLSELQFQRQVFVPEGDWLVGIKSAVFLGVPVREEDWGLRVGQICLASPVPNLFGEQDIWEDDRQAGDFFAAYVNEVPTVTEPVRKFCDLFKDCVDYRETGATQLAMAWMSQTVGLTHKHRAEAETVRDQCCGSLDRFFEFAYKQRSFRNLVQRFDRLHPRDSIGSLSLRDRVTKIRSITEDQLAFYEFLRHYSYLCQRKLGVPSELIEKKLRHIRGVISKDRNRSITFGSFETFERHVELTGHRFGPIEWERSARWESASFKEAGAITYILYQLLENAHRHKSDASAIRCSARTFVDASERKMLEFNISNEVRMLPADERQGTCGRCGKQSRSRYYFTDRDRCRSCTIQALVEFFNNDGWRWPQKSDGFGLFMVREFIVEFYGGTLKAETQRTRGAVKVAFVLQLPTEQIKRDVSL
jgi:hypothetical protein